QQASPNGMSQHQMCLLGSKHQNSLLRKINSAQPIGKKWMMGITEGQDGMGTLNGNQVRG
ncbi:MAG TPA: hypothetical protein VLM37_08785, partial [Fibrobacteraceae bacterium]|nr:hypothetical protein [Fibrobacteraceae bacterium]